MIYSYNFFAQNVFLNKSTYKNLIDELISLAPENYFYLLSYEFQTTDNSDSKIKIDFKVKDKKDEELNDKIITSSSRLYETVNLSLQYSVGNGEDQCWKKESPRFFPFFINVMEESHAGKDVFSYINKFKTQVLHNFYNYEFKNKINGKTTFADLEKEIAEEIKRLKQNFDKKEKKYWSFSFTVDTKVLSMQSNNVISKQSLWDEKYYIVRLGFLFDDSKNFGFSFCPFIRQSFS